MPERSRLFLSLPIPVRIGERALALLSDSALEDVRLVPAKNLHVTLLFIGSTARKQVGEVVDTVRELISDVEPEPVTFSHLDWGPPKGEVRMIWAYGTGGEVWHRLKFALRSALHEKGLYADADEHPFLPHITLARLEAKPRRELPEHYVDFQESFTPDTVLLMESRLQQPHPDYAVVEQFPLKT